MAHSVMKLVCPICGYLNALVSIDGDVTRKVRDDVRALILSAHVRDYHPVSGSRWKATVERARRENAGAR